MAGFRIIELAAPFLPIMPEIELPYDKLPFDDKVVYTILIGLFYIFSQLPIAGINTNGITSNAIEGDPLYYLRGIFAMGPSKTILEFGLFPIVSSTLILQLLAGMKLIKVNFKNSQDRQLFQSLTKIVSVFLYIILTNIFIATGYFGANLSLLSILLINFQIVSMGIFTILLVEIIDKSYGFGSGIMCITVMNTATNFVDNVFGVASINVDTVVGGNYTESRGAFINLTQNLRSSRFSLIGGIVSAFTRDYLPNLTHVSIVALIFFIVCYWQNYNMEVTIRSTRTRNINNVYPIRMLYTGGLSIYFSFILIALINISIYVFLNITHLSNKYYVLENNTLLIPKFPFNLLTPPKAFYPDLFTKQILTLLILPIFIIISSCWFSLQWMNISGASPKDIALQFKEQSITIAGKREQAIKQELNNKIRPAAIAGGLVLGGIVSLGELLGLKGDAAGIVVAVTSGFALLELVTIEYQQSGGKSALTQILGAPGGKY
ncbi:Ssh1p SCDLUD_003539 [Saccharomycodes ludwigii]|uniref:Ssh1p n=1 Tax=Saccharomycodes ludwigii TaxID=36035 RepID=UPI001E888D36|nr:hypothetical protein SCDLUD_003539 [Saccharomycodes ludwigii]KAH3900550.1 hypothetical protein SCDLUD_003539 [Saccharomycodes ludwigii]